MKTDPLTGSRARFRSLVVLKVWSLFTLLLLNYQPTFAQCKVKAFANYTDLVCGDTLLLDAMGNGDLAFRNNFDCKMVQCPQGNPANPNDNYGLWSYSSSAQFDNPCAPPHPGGTPHIWFNQNTPSPRILATQPLPLANGGVIKFDMRYADPNFNENMPPCENPDEADEGVHLQYSIDNGATWRDIKYYDPDGGYDPQLVKWNTYIIRVPDSAETNSTLIRWAQLNNTGEAGAYLDHWGLDNLEIVANPANSYYRWDHETINRDIGTAAPFVPINSGPYALTYFDGFNTCRDTINITVKKPTIDITKNPSAPVCPGTPVQLKGTSTLENPDFLCRISPTGCRGDKIVIPLGTDSIRSNNYYFFGSPTVGPQELACVNSQSNYVNSSRTQFIVKASEINAVFKKGQINRLYFYSPIKIRAYQYHMRVGCTNKTQFASTAASEFQSGLSEVYFKARCDFFVGWNVFTFDSAFDWDGTSNLVFEICFNGAGPITGDLFKSNSGFYSVLHAEDCDALRCNSTYGTARDTYRPTIRLGVCYRPDPILDFQWSPSAGLDNDTIKTPIATVSTNSTFNLTVWDINTPITCAVTQSVNIQMNNIGNLDAQFDSLCDSGTLKLKGVINAPAGTTYSWTGPGGWTSNLQNPTRDPAVAGWYYFEAVNGTCKGKDSVFVVIDTIPRSGDPYTLNVCQNEKAVDLFAGLTGNPHSTGTWTATGTPSGATALSGKILDASKLPTVPGTYTFDHKVDLKNTCGPRTTVVTVNANKQGFAGGDTTFTQCNSGSTINLFSKLKKGTGNKAPDSGGSWSDVSTTSAGSAFTTSNSDLNLNGLPANTYKFMYIVSSGAPCTDDTAFVTVKVNNQPDAGSNGAGDVCYTGSINLPSKLSGTITPGGTWRKKTAFAGTLDATTGDFTSTGSIADTGTYVFVYTVSATSPCLADSSTVTVHINGYPKISNPQATCSADKSSFTVTFNVNGGDASSYLVDEPGTFSGNNPKTFTSQPISNGTNARFIVSDAKACRNDTLTITRDCSCQTAAGTMNLTPLNLCQGASSTNSYAGGFVNDGNDVMAYYLHRGSSALTGVIDSNLTGIFTFKAGMTLGQTYYISAVAANNASGYPSVSDPCKSVAAGTPVIWNTLPDGSISSSAANICPGDEAKIDITFTKGKEPFSMEVFDGSSTQSYNFLAATDQIGVYPLDTTDYYLVKITDDNGCAATINKPKVTINVNAAPIADLKPVITCSDGTSNLGELKLDVQGSGSVFDVVITNSLNGNKDTVVGSLPAFNWKPPYFDPNQAISYSIESVKDNSGSVCPGVGTGSVTIYPVPTAVMTGGGVYCQGTQVIVYFDLTGIAPWKIDYTDGTTNYTKTTSFPHDSVIHAASSAGNYTYTISTISDRNGTGCAGTFSGQAPVQVNSPAQAQLLVEDPGTLNRVVNDEYCNGSVQRNLVIAIDPNTGFGNTFDVTYAVNGNPQTVQVTRPELKVSVSPPVGTRNYVITDIKDQSSATCPGTGSPSSIKVNAIPFANLLASQTEACLGTPIQLSVSIGGTGTINYTVQGQGADTQTYSGSGTSGTITITVNPTQVGPATYSITAISDNNNPVCNGTSNSTVTINVNPPPTAAFATPNYELCEGSTLQLTYSITGSLPVKVTYTGAGKTKTVSKTAGTYTDNIFNLLPGTYTYTITEVAYETGGTCTGTTGSTCTVIIRPKPQVGLKLNPNPVCLGEPATLTFTPVGNPNFAVTYADDLGNTYPVETNINGTRTVSIPTDRNRSFRTVLITDGSDPDGPATFCQNTNPNQRVDLIVNPLPTGSLQGTSEICKGEAAAIQLDLQGKAPFTVEFDEHRTSGSSITKTASFNTSGLNSYALNPDPIDSLNYSNLKITDGNGCIGQGTGTAQVNVNPIPKPNFTMDPANGCSPLPVDFTNVPEGSYQYNALEWDFGDGSPKVNDPTNNAQHHIYIDRTMYSVTLNVESKQGCKGSVSKQVIVFPDPIADFFWSPTPVTVQDNMVRFLNRSSFGANYTWSFGTGDSATDYEPLYTFPTIGEVTYPVCLVAQSGFGCLDTLCKDLFIEGITMVNIPNSFTPDGDGTNDSWKPVCEGIRRDLYELTVFDRWGGIVWSTKDPDKGWTGFGINNEDCKVDVYTYQLKAHSLYSAERINKTGHVSLLR